MSDPAASAHGVRVTGLRKVYRFPGQELEILHNLDFAIEPGESVAVVGRSGAGKSTLLHQIGLLDQPTEGSIAIQGLDVTRAGRKARDRIRRDTIGFVFQFYHLLAELSALQNVMLSGMIGVGALAWLRRRSEEHQRAEALLERVGLGDRMHHRPSRLSGGERQRVAIARALFRSPALLLCDEPTGNLDEKTSEDVERLLLELHTELRSMMVLVTHNLRLAGRLDRVLLLESGSLHDVQEKLGQDQTLADMIR